MKFSSPSLLVSVLLSAAVAPACGGGVSVSAEGSVATGGGSTAIAFAATAGVGLTAAAEPDVVVASGTRGEVDVLSHDTGDWRLFGSYFSGDSVEVAGGHVAGGDVVFVRNADGEVALLPTLAGAAHRLGFPVSIYHFTRGGAPTDASPPAAGFAVGDLDGDGSSEAVIAAPGLGLVVLPGLAAATAATANAESPPTINGYKLPAGDAPTDVAIADLDGDGVPDVAALDGMTPTLRLYQTTSRNPLDIVPLHTLALPAVGVSLRATGCAARPLVVALADGRLVSVAAADGAVAPLVDKLTPVAQLASSGDALVLDSDRAGLALVDACAASDGQVDGPTATSALALTPADAMRARKLAVLDADGATVSLFSLR